MSKNLNQDIKDLFRTQGKKVKIYLRSSKTKGSNFDIFRNTNYTIKRTNPLFVKAIIKDAQPESLIVRELGLTFTGAKDILIQDKDVNLFRIAEKIEIDDMEYYTQDDAVGNKMLIFKRQLGYSRIILFRKEK